ncbi:MAG: amidohydrolase [Eggerthellaceae bacterium]|nr:amidohydrolase [Eggerthellaceae bacterium]
MSDSVVQLVRDMGRRFETDIVAWRRYLHSHPELSAKEFATSDYLCAQLDDMGVEHVRVQGKRPEPAEDGREDYIGTGIVATVRGAADGAYDAEGKPSRCVALRTDIDALPITELNEVDYVSRNEGVMHACGHDCHMAMMLGTVRMLVEMRDWLRGEVRILFQPAEEISIGAKDMIAAGALDGVDAIYGAHIWSEVDSGVFSCEAGPRMANTDWFRIDIDGVSAHGSMPHKGVDAVVIAAEIVDAIQVLVSRRVSPFEPVAVTIGEIHGGTARNIMAGSAWLAGTMRTWHADVRERMRFLLEAMSERTAEVFGANISFDFTEGNSGVINDQECSDVAKHAVEQVLGARALATYEGTMAGEDFAEYQKIVPGVFVFVGTNNPEVGAVHPQHSCYYTVDETALARGSMVAAQWAHDMLAR